MSGEIRFHQPRNARGHFQQFEQSIKDFMVQEAKEYQEEVANYITSHIKRKTDSSGRLARVTRDPENRDPGTVTWRVGIPSFLNRSEAKYWRLIEQGSAGLYGHGRGFRGYPLKLRPGGWPGGRPFRSFPKGTRPAKLGSVFYKTNRGEFKMAYVKVTVKNEIQPMNAYRTVYENNGWKARTLRDFEQSVRRSFLR